MPNELQHLQVKEVSLVDAPANSSTTKDGRRNPHARVALWKRDTSSDDDDDLHKAVDGKTQDGVRFPASDWEKDFAGIAHRYRTTTGLLSSHGCARHGSRRTRTEAEKNCPTS